MSYYEIGFLVSALLPYSSPTFFNTLLLTHKAVQHFKQPSTTWLCFTFIKRQSAEQVNWIISSHLKMQMHCSKEFNSPNAFFKISSDYAKECRSTKSTTRSLPWFPTGDIPLRMSPIPGWHFLFQMKLFSEMLTLSCGVHFFISHWANYLLRGAAACLPVRKQACFLSLRKSSMTHPSLFQGSFISQYSNISTAWKSTASQPILDQCF